MSTTRREFLVRSAAAGSAIGLGVLPKIELGAESRSHAVRERAAKPLNILIIGGTGFTGPEQVG